MMTRSDIVDAVQPHFAQPRVPRFLHTRSLKMTPIAQQLYDELWFAVHRSIEHYRMTMLRLDPT